RVGRLADDHRVDVAKGHLGVLERAQRRLAAQPGQRHVGALGRVLGLAHSDDGAAVHDDASSTHTRFCCRHGPEVAWPSVRRALPSRMRCAASPSRASPATMSGLAASAPPDGLTATFLSSCNDSRKMISWCEYGACNSATSMGAVCTPASTAARAVE